MQVGAQTVETSMDDYSSSGNPFLPGHLRGHALSATVGAPQAGAPPLKPTLKLYRELYRMGFSVTFITGRQAQSTLPGPGLTVREMRHHIRVLYNPVQTCLVLCFCAA